MTHSSVPAPSPDQETLFAAAAADYARYRPGVPEAAVRLLADTLRGRADPVLLDLGTGTGQVPLALRHAVPDLAHIEAVDVSRQMLDRARAALAPVLGRCTLTLVHATADEYQPPAPQPGEAVLRPALVTCCRSYHWMPGPAVLDMADRVTAPDAAVAIMGDGSLWTHQAEWTRALREVIQAYLGSERRAGTRTTYTEPRRSYQEDLAASAFTEVSEHRYPVARTWTPAAVVGYLRSTSFAHPDLFQERHEAFEAEAHHLLDTYAKDGTLQEEAVFTVLLARRPKAAS
ncbi:class I SAM-dependent methyltransferase [Streptomyces sp. NPDC006510]|uniref:class I SAM-dependent methyltransferase n=1 Tax=Streptomyces sp. NPDC006510 TaxID=3155600 RepID=UPI0033A815FD